MRDNRIRAWHVKDKVMLYFCDQVSNGDCITSKGDMHSQKSFISWNGDAYNNGVLQKPEDLIILHSLGIRDLDGKNIWEGDLVAFDDSPIGGRNGVGEIIWCDDLTLVSFPGYVLWCNGVLPNFPFHPKVIGNKYENPKIETWSKPCDKEEPKTEITLDL